MNLVSWDCVRQAHFALMQLYLITGNEVSYQKTSLPMCMLKVTLMSYKALVKRYKISCMLKQTGIALAPVYCASKRPAHVLQTLKCSQSA